MMRLWICERWRAGGTSGDGGGGEEEDEDVEGDVEDVGKLCRRATVQTTSNLAPDLAKPVRALAKKPTSAAAILSAGSGGADGRGIVEAAPDEGLLG